MIAVAVAVIFFSFLAFSVLPGYLSGGMWKFHLRINNNNNNNNKTEKTEHLKKNLYNTRLRVVQKFQVFMREIGNFTHKYCALLFIF